MPTPPESRDAVTGWFIYKCGSGTLLVPAPRCIGPECQGAGPRGTKTIGYAGDLAAGENGGLSGARRAAGLTAATGGEIAAATTALDDLRRSGAISDSYYRQARAAVENRPEKFLGLIAPGVRRDLLGQPIAPRALAELAGQIPGSPVGPSVAEGCQCTPRPPDGRDPVSGWFIYYVPGGVLITPTWKCLPSGGGPLSWLQQTWKNTVALFQSPPASPAPPKFPALAPVTATGATAPASTPPPPPTCVPDEVTGRDPVSGWYIVRRDGKWPVLVANPNFCGK